MEESGVGVLQLDELQSQGDTYFISTSSDSRPNSIMFFKQRIRTEHQPEQVTEN